MSLGQDHLLFDQRVDRGASLLVHRRFKLNGLVEDDPFNVKGSYFFLYSNRWRSGLKPYVAVRRQFADDGSNDASSAPKLHMNSEIGSIYDVYR
jgi:hypothetical protein